MKYKFYFLYVILFLSNTLFAQDWKVYPSTPAGSILTFPKDEGRHASEPIEWWYISGNLKGSTSGKTYSFMLTYFHYPASTFDGFRILNITDDATGLFYEDTKPVNYTSLSQDQLNIEAKVFAGGNESWVTKKDGENKLIPFEYTINAASTTAGFSLDCKSLKRPLIIGEDGYIEQGSSSYSYYYSQTSIEVSGTLVMNGIGEQVKGMAWIDRQYGDFNPLTGEKYEWFHLQLTNGMDINLWNIFTQHNTIPKDKNYRILTSYVDENTQYQTSDFNLERLAYNWMPDSAMCYSSQWRLTSAINKMDLIITTKNKNTEIKWPFRFYEGATTISGTVNGSTVTGFGFAELLHSYEHPKVSVNTSGGTWNFISPISWKITNPDDARSLVYDIEYSINNKASFLPIAQALTDTFYKWNNAALSNNDEVWFKITARSADSQLRGSALSSASVRVVVPGATDQEIKLFPNPAGNELWIKSGIQINNPVYRIVDEKGRVIRSFKSNSLPSKINVNYLPAGIYFLKIKFGEESLLLKFIKL